MSNRLGLGRRWAAGLVAALAGCGGGPADPAIVQEIVGSWRLVMVCAYDTDSRGCEAAQNGRLLTFRADGTVSSSSPEWTTSYRIDVRQLGEGRTEVLLIVPDDAPEGGPPAQLWIEADTLTISRAYVDGSEERYVRSTPR